ncbi:MAG TPA: hypothetical protein VIV60_15930, partial [Polyangiaceae bacterium]
SSCSWVQMGTGSTEQSYKFDLTRPMNCTAPDCAVDLQEVRSVSIASEWATPCAAQDKCDDPREDALYRPFGPKNFSVSSLSFELSNDAAADWSAYDGTRGANEWCWRAQAYEPGALTILTMSNEGVVTSQLSGPKYTAARLVADFGDRGRDLSRCTKVMLEGTKASKIVQFVLEDVFGSWTTGNIPRCSAEDCGLAFSIETLQNPAQSSTNIATSKRTVNFANFPTAFDYTRVRYFGIQKDWTEDVSAAAITIRNVQFSQTNGEPCE